MNIGLTLLLAFIAYMIIIIGFIQNTASVTVGADDKDCSGPGQLGKHDEDTSERIENNCIKYCETYPIWYNIGRDEDCYWDDE